MDELALSCYGVEVRLVDAAGLALCQRLHDTLPPEFAPPSEPAEAVVAYVVTAGDRPGTAESPEYLITCDGVAVFATDLEEEVFGWLRQDIDQAVARRSPQRLFVHAGVVGWRGVAIVIPGRRATGKSTLVAELVRRGAVYYSDAFAVLDETGRVHPYRRTLGHDVPAEPLPIGLIVAGAYQPGSVWRPTIVRGAHATLPLIDHTVLAREEATRLPAIAARVAPTVVTLRGPRPEATEVATHLLDLVDDALVRARAAENQPPPLSTHNVSPLDRGHANRLVAIVTPHHRFPLSADEQISLRHLRTYLGKFDRYMIGPQSPPREFSDFCSRPFSARHFTNHASYNHLLVSEQFYRAFSDYEYILIYQLDALVFSSDLEAWCRKDWDYIGAPWFAPWYPRPYPSSAIPEDPVDRHGTVGNGGFSLRKVDSALAVLTSPKRLLDDRLIQGVMKYSGWHEDLFWSFSAQRLVENFRVPRARQALEFAFETEPRFCYRENSGRLPFGCHAWSLIDREFWEPFLLN